MARPDEATVRAALAAVSEEGVRLTDQATIAGVTVKDGNVHVALEIDPAAAGAMEALRRAAEAAVGALDGVLSATVILTAHRAEAAGRDAPPAQAAPGRQPGPAGGAGAGARAALPGVRAIVAVASGKGGVGKSTVAANLAVALAADGLAVGLLDADIYGPSVPRMLGISGQPQSGAGDKLEPMVGHGVKTMSMGFLVDEETPMIWRGPMVMGALQQMLGDVNWGELDILVLDMPPGTGDAQLTIAQRVPVTGAVIVSTPQDIALLDARKGLNMFRKVDVPVMGIVENMSVYHCPNCGHEAHIFGDGGARAEAKRLDVPLLAEIPLTIETRIAGDAGEPVVLAAPDSAPALAFRHLSKAVQQAVDERLGAKKRLFPKIRIF